MKQALSLTPVWAPHLRGQASFIKQSGKNLAGILILVLAACFLSGMPFIILAGSLFVFSIMLDVIFQSMGFKAKPRIDMAFFQQALLWTLFIPATGSFFVYAGATGAWVAFYRFSNGRSGYVLPPICVGLAWLQCFGIPFEWGLISLPQWASAVIFALWIGICFPKTKMEIIQKISLVALALMLSLFQEINFASAAVMAIAIGEIIFDSAIAPAFVRARIGLACTVLGGFTFLSISFGLNFATVVSGLSAGFFAGIFEHMSLEKGAQSFAKAR